ncbi:OsmC family protein [Achromobacter sp. GG226]|uniref:OsmC family protein n=1 Tax=Verticiella alkaliphila TaxID=2779529 RepID=UPI001C0CC65B|nr:OsmC family protein [Verticiella sp. GG226]MBU4610069.1 OsmC family protein [Verticiella sp. GG226]
MKKFGSAVWEGDLKQGKGTVSTESGALSAAPYGFNARFTEGAGTNPEELIGAAHAGCFSMALSMMLGEAGFTADRIETRATVTLDKKSAGFEITAVHLDVTAKIPKATQQDFDAIARKAKEGCPVSRVLNAEITMDAKLQTA